MEKWRDIPGYEKLYSVSNHGNVWSHCSSKRMTPQKRKKKDGFLQLNLVKKGVPRTFLVHRLVALAFFPEVFSAKDGIVHKDGDVENNRLTNLHLRTACNRRRKTLEEKQIGVRKLTRKKGVVFTSYFYLSGRQVYCGIHKTASAARKAAQLIKDQTKCE